VVVNSFAQEIPFVYDVENTCADCPAPPLLSFYQLPTIQSLPDPFEWSDGRGSISNFSDWQWRRAEIGTQVQYYEQGTKPAPPDTLDASFSADSILTVTITVGGNTLTLTCEITLPQGDGPFPAVIGVGWSGAGSLPADIFTSRGIATIHFNESQITNAWSNVRGDGPFFTLYPDKSRGKFIAWAWGVSRIIDGLEKVPEAKIDLRHLAVTGCSYAGKIALVSGAFDERIALTIAQESGGGGYTAWRVTETLSGSRETLRNAQGQSWYYSGLSQFNEAVTKLPYDHHELMAMVAPRALFVTGNPNYEWLADESGHVASKAAHEVWKALGVPDRFGFSIVGGHDHCVLPESERPEVVAFVEKFLLGDTTANTDISTSPYNTDLSSWITWDTPTLSNGTSYFGRTSLIYPQDLQTGLDTITTFRWHIVPEGEKYFFQLSTDAAFTNIVASDSTTDTVKTISGLLEGKRYYWHVQVKNIAGSFGPFSDIWNFSTFIPLPTAPQLVDASPNPNLARYYIFMWKKANYADQYIIQLSHGETFSTILKTDSTTSDTVITLTGFTEGRNEYWRVKAKNIAGSSPWSDSSLVTKLLAPTNLVLQQSASNEITLTWVDHSTKELGYVIERKQSPQPTFTLLDTLKGIGNQYVDSNVELAQTYTYRTKAYNNITESDYSDEVSLTVTGITEETGLPTEFSMSQNYPNPFNPTTKIKIALPQAVLTKLIVYDLLGREVQILINKELEAGYHEINFDASHLTNGVYFYRIQAGNFTETKKLLLLK